jgi:hypothetical protein
MIFDVIGILPVFLIICRYAYWGPDRPDSMLYYPISWCGSIASLPEPQFLLLPTVTCVQSDHVPKSPAEMLKTQLWTLITFFWLGSFIPNLTKILIFIYNMYISVCRSLLPFWAVKKKIDFLRIPSTIKCYYSTLTILKALRSASSHSFTSKQPDAFNIWV